VFVGLLFGFFYIVLVFILKLIGDLYLQWVIGVRVFKQVPNGLQYISNFNLRTPTLPQHIIANRAFGLFYIWVINLSNECKLGGFEGVLLGNVNINIEITTFVRAFFRSSNLIGSCTKCKRRAVQSKEIGSSLPSQCSGGLC